MDLKTKVYNVVLSHAKETGNCRQIIEAPFEDMVDEIVKLFAIPAVNILLPENKCPCPKCTGLPSIESFYEDDMKGNEC